MRENVAANTVAGTVRVVEDPRFDVTDFHRRWDKARRSALKAHGAGPGIDEAALLREVREGSREGVLREVFDRSRALGRSVVRYLGLTWELGDLEDVLSRSPSPCLAGRWSRRDGARVLTRPGCPGAGARLDPFVCDYWREAIDGLVTGTGADERFARHQSLGHGDPGCLDVFFEDSPASAGRWGPVPPEIELGLTDLRVKLSRSDTRLVLVGLREGTLYYRLENPKMALCGPGGALLHEMVGREVHTRFPAVAVRDASPVAVYGGQP
jgi:hypothetical protein